MLGPALIWGNLIQLRNMINTCRQTYKEDDVARSIRSSSGEVDENQLAMVTVTRSRM